MYGTDIDLCTEPVQIYVWNRYKSIKPVQIYGTEPVEFYILIRTTYYILIRTYLN